jgi:hypothetical protein
MAGRSHHFAQAVSEQRSGENAKGHESDAANEED